MTTEAIPKTCESLDRDAPGGQNKDRFRNCGSLLHFLH